MQMSHYVVNDFIGAGPEREMQMTRPPPNHQAAHTHTRPSSAVGTSHLIATQCERHLSRVQRV